MKKTLKTPHSTKLECRHSKKAKLKKLHYSEPTKTDGDRKIAKSDCCHYCYCELPTLEWFLNTQETPVVAHEECVYLFLKK